MECARNTAPSLNDGLNSNPASWTCNFDGGIKLKAGDAISINSATLNSVGVGPLINFTLNNENGSQNNKATWIHSFYVVNDGKNDKRSSLNMDGNFNGDRGVFRWDTTNNDCDLYRWSNIGTEFEDAARTVTYYQDNFLPLRVDKTEVDVDSSAQVLDIQSQDYVINILTDTNGAAPPTGNATYFSVNEVAADGTLGIIIPVMERNVFQRGRVYRMKNVNVAGLDNPAQYNDPTMNVIFGVIEVFQNTGNDRIVAPDGEYVKCTPFGNLVQTSDADRQAFQIKSVEFEILSGDVNFGQTAGGLDYSYTPAFYDWESQLYNAGDNVFQADYQLLNPTEGVTAAGNKIIEPITSAGQAPKGIVIQDNLTKYTIDILAMPSNGDAGGGIYPQQGYATNFKFKLNGVTFDTIADMVTANDEVKQFGVRIYTQTGYKYAMLFLGADDDSSTIINKNTITATSNVRGCQMYFGVNEKPELSGQGDVLFRNSDVPVPVNSDDNPHQILFLGKLNQNISIRYFNTIKQVFTGNFVQNKNLRSQGTVTKEVYFLKSAITTNTTLFNADYTSVFPVNIEGYTGGVLRSFDYFKDDDSTRQDQFANNFQYIRHYEHFSYEISSSWNSPSDIATALTDQTHFPDNARSPNGEVLENTTGLGIPHNRLCIPVWTTNAATENDLLTHTNLVEGSFKIVDPSYANVAVTPAFKGDGLPQTVTQNDVDIFFRTSETSINYPSSITNTPRNLVYNSANPVNRTTELPPDFNQGNTLMGTTNYIRTAISVNTDGDQVPYPLTYINGQPAYISQFAGANDVSFGWDDNLSRFTIGDLHVGIFSITQIGDPATGGQDEVKIYVPALPYKQNQTRSGGVSIENWYSITPTINMGLETIINQIGQTYDFNFTAEPINSDNEWFLTASNRDPIGKRFWNKLGFDDTQIGVGGSLVGVSTRNEIDTAIGIIPSQEPASNRPAYNDKGNFASDNNNQGGGTGDAAIAGFEFSSFGNLNFNNHTVGMGGIPNTQGAPLQFFPNVKPAATLSRTNKTVLTGDEAGKIIDSEGQYNPDREFNTYYSVTTKDDMSTTLDALNLPVKTEFSYFYILSDLVESKFYSSKNGGMPINCIGTINKLNSDNDYYFSYASPQRIYVTQDRIVTSITTSVKNIDFSDPAIIGNFSSVVYQIDRMNPVPETIPLPVSIQQDNYFNELYALTEQVLKESKLPSTEDAILQVIEDLYVGGEPTENRAQIVNDVIDYGIEVEAAAAPAPPDKPQSESGLGTSIGTSEMTEGEKEKLEPRQTRGMTKKAALTAADRVAQRLAEQRAKEQEEIRKRSRTARQPFAVRPMPNESREDYQRRAREFYKEYQSQGEVGDLPYLKPPPE